MVEVIGLGMLRMAGGFILSSEGLLLLVLKSCVRHVAIVGKKGHVASFDWQTGKMHCELQLRETCRDITCVFPTLIYIPSS